MTKFAFLIHPLKPKDVVRFYPIAKYVPDPVIKAFLRGRKPRILSEVKGIVSKTGATTEGWFIGCPLTSAQLAGEV
ncbi:MAG: shikimate dehydrogenase, partial [Armatimonadota bacterium]